MDLFTQLLRESGISRLLSSTETINTLKPPFRLVQKANFSRSPHEISVNSATGQTSQDSEHLTAELRGGGQGTRKVHVYLEGRGTGATAYDNMWVSGDSVMKRTNAGYVLDKKLSTGTYAMAGPSGAATTTAPATAAASTSASSASVSSMVNKQGSE